MEKRVKYDKNALAAMAARNYEEGKKACGDGKRCVTDPVDCIAKVFAAPLETLAQVEEDYAKVRDRVNHANRLIEMFAQNIGGAVQVADPNIVEAAENYLGRKLTGPVSRN